MLDAQRRVQPRRAKDSQKTTRRNLGVGRHDLVGLLHFSVLPAPERQHENREDGSGTASDDHPQPNGMKLRSEAH
jgi:hypothetical protein